MTIIKRTCSLLISAVLGYGSLKLFGTLISFLKGTEGGGDVGATFGGVMALILPSILLIISVQLLLCGLTGRKLLEDHPGRGI